MSTIRIANPTGLSAQGGWSVATRAQQLGSLRLGLLHNSKPGGDALLRAAARELTAKYDVEEAGFWAKRSPSLPSPYLSDMVGACDVAMVAVGD